ncbi:hypothetical protein F5Y16DRAFT_388437 [Xylariaceae sp. FL0255]|nr:hypothetical protein F5Y16DRAFT_388437 [Xylariaceae sp. FL0255]
MIIGAIVGVAVTTVLGWFVFHYRRRPLGRAKSSGGDYDNNKDNNDKLTNKGGPEIQFEQPLYQKAELSADPVRYELVGDEPQRDSLVATTPLPPEIKPAGD